MKKLYIILGLLLATSAAFAQFEEDALRFSRLSVYGTARSAAMGGAFGALGGDLSTLSTNPAGIGVFRKSEFSFTPYMNFGNTKSGNRSVDDASFQIGNLGGVISFYNPNFDWRGFNFGINYTNMNNFNRKLDQEVVNSTSSLLDVYAASSSYPSFIPSEDLLPYSESLAYQSYLMNQVKTGDGSLIYQSVLTEGELVNQYKMIKEDGYQGEYALSFGTNYKDKLYLGMTIGLQSVYYKMSSTYTEYAALNSPSELDFYDYYEYQKINGVGTNLKFGIIYRPIPEVRIGASIHTPTWYNMNYTYDSHIYSQFTTSSDPITGRDQASYEAYPDYVLKRDYDMKTPWRAILSVATVLQQKAILSMDYEYVDYRSARFSDASDNLNYGQTNQNIKDLYRGGHNLRVGAEYRFNTTFSLRGGYNYQASPYKDSGFNFVNSISGGDKLQAFSGGFGLNFGQFYCDAAYLYKYGKDKTIFYYYPDEGIIADPVKNKYVSNEARLTLGLRF